MIPNCNKHLIHSSVEHNHRIDGRKRDEYRHLEIVFGQKLGSVLVAMGNTRVLATVTAEIAEPKITRPSEGLLRISVDLSPMASPFFEVNRLTDESVELSRMLERSIREARSFDTESLCLISGKKCWALEANLVVLNTEGNVVECCSVALITALSHFRRKDVTVTSNEELIIHEFDEKNPIPLTIFHYPFCTKFCAFGNNLVVDPLESEENVCEGYIVVGANAHREVTALHISGRSTISSGTILKCCNRAIERTNRLTEYVKTALESDKEMRANPETAKQIGFTHYLISSGAALLGSARLIEDLDPEDEEEEQMEEDEVAENTKAYRFAPENMIDPEEEDRPIGTGGPSAWGFDEEDDDDVQIVSESHSAAGGKKKDKMISLEDDDDSSSDGEVVVMEANEFK